MSAAPWLSTTWEEHTTPTGQKYYYNSSTGESSWTKPSSEELPPGWNEYTADDGRTYYYNEETEESVWERPEIKKKEELDINGLETYTAETGPKALMKLFQYSQIKVSDSFDVALRTLTNYPLYFKSVTNPLERRKLFQEYIEELYQRNTEDESKRMEGLRASTIVLLQKENVKSYSRFQTVQKELSLEDSDDVRAIFDDYITSLRKEEADKEKEKKAEGLAELNELFDIIAVEHNTRWNSVKDRILTSSSFIKDSPLSRLDILIAFENHVKALEKNFNESRADQKAKWVRMNRKNRETYLQLLDELIKNGHLTALSTWKAILPLFKQDDRYLNMLEQGGSSPLDFFWDTIEQLSARSRDERNLILDLLEEKKVEISKLQYEEFLAFCNSDPRTRFGDTSIKEHYKYLQDKVKRRQEEDKRHDERKLRRKIDDLRYIIKHLEPPVNLDDKWEDVRKRVETSREYNDLDEESRKSAFDKHIRRLKERELDEQRDVDSRNRPTNKDKGRSRSRKVDKISDQKERSWRAEEGRDLRKRQSDIAEVAKRKKQRKEDPLHKDDEDTKMETNSVSEEGEISA